MAAFLVNKRSWLLTSGWPLDVPLITWCRGAYDSFSLTFWLPARLCMLIWNVWSLSKEKLRENLVQHGSFIFVIVFLSPSSHSFSHSVSDFLTWQCYFLKPKKAQVDNVLVSVSVIFVILTSDVCSLSFARLCSLFVRNRWLYFCWFDVFLSFRLAVFHDRISWPHSDISRTWQYF